MISANVIANVKQRETKKKNWYLYLFIRKRETKTNGIKKGAHF